MSTKQRRPRARAAVPRLFVRRSDEWVSSDPRAYVDALHVLCRQELRLGVRVSDWGVGWVVACCVGQSVKVDQHDVVKWLNKHCLERIESYLQEGQTVADPLWQIYNLTARIDEAIEAKRDARAAS